MPVLPLQVVCWFVSQSWWGTVCATDATVQTGVLTPRKVKLRLSFLFSSVEKPESERARAGVTHTGVHACALRRSAVWVPFVGVWGLQEQSLGHGSEWMSGDRGPGEVSPGREAARERRMNTEVIPTVGNRSLILPASVKAGMRHTPPRVPSRADAVGALTQPLLSVWVKGFSQEAFDPSPPAPRQAEGGPAADGQVRSEALCWTWASVAQRLGLADGTATASASVTCSRVVQIIQILRLRWTFLLFTGARKHDLRLDVVNVGWRIQKT